MALEEQLRHLAAAHARIWTESNPTVVALREAAGLIAEMRAALEQGRALFRNPSRNCECEDCVAIRKIDAVLAKAKGEGDGNESSGMADV